MDLTQYTVKKVSDFPQPGCHLPNSPWPGIIKIFSARESFVGDIPAGGWKIVNSVPASLQYWLLRLHEENPNIPVLLRYDLQRYISCTAYFVFALFI
jgi:hypothetical protein